MFVVARLSEIDERQTDEQMIDYSDMFLNNFTEILKISTVTGDT